jgi:putative hemolysin
MTLQFVVLLVLIILSGVFSSTETAFTSLSYMQIQELKQKHGKRGRLVQKLSNRPDILLTTILIGNNLVNISASALATKITIDLFGNSAVGITTGILTLIILVFSEVTPKRLAIMFNEFISLRTARFVQILSIIFRPVIFIIGLISNGITRLFGSEGRTRLSLEGILHMVNLGENLGIVEQYETSMIKRVFRFNDITVQAIMTHRTEVFSIDMTTPVNEALDSILEEGYSRIPVYDKDPENIAGIVLLRDLIKMLSTGNQSKPLKECMMEPIFVPETKMVNEMFMQFKQEKLNMAIILDEYGGLAGVVTVEDVIEEILGDLYDEHEIKENKRIRKMDHGQYLLAADISLHQLNEALGIRLPSHRYAKTLGGFLVDYMDHIPGRGEEVILRTGRFIIETIEKNRILWVRYIPAKQEHPAHS